MGETAEQGISIWDGYGQDPGQDRHKHRGGRVGQRDRTGQGPDTNKGEGGWDRGTGQDRDQTQTRGRAGGTERGYGTDGNMTGQDRTRQTPDTNTGEG